MANLNKRICANCNSEYSNVYVTTDGYDYTRNTEYCSKSCAVKHFRAIPREALVKKALDYIHGQNKYCTSTELCAGIGHSCKTLTKYGLKVTELNNELGFNKPKSKFQEKVGEFLKQEFLDVETEKTFDGLVGITGHSLRVDFYLPVLNMVVEADGAQHTDSEHPWSEWNNGTVKEYDEIKNRFFEEKGIRLCRVPYKRNLKDSDISSCLN